PPRPPYRWDGLAWEFAALEPDPEDVLEPLPPGIRGGETSPAAQLAGPDVWERLRRDMGGRLAVYAEPVRRAAAWVMARDAHGPDDIALLAAAARLGLAPEAMSKAVAAMDRLLAAPAWGNPNPEAYAHNGDMGAMAALRALAWAWRAMPEELGPERRARVLDRLRRQGDVFFDLMLLNRDYWGGSVIQDHGWRSVFGFAAVALSLLGAAPEAERWLRLLLPRARRSLDAMPRDGAAPAGAHKHLFNYMHEVTQFRDALLAATGEDIFDQPQFAPILDCFAALLAPPGGGAPDAGARFCLVGANRFLNLMAAKFGRSDAAAMEQWLLAPEPPRFPAIAYEGRYYAGLVEGLMSRDPDGPAPRQPRPPRLLWLRDSGRVLYRDDAARLSLSLACGPGSGYHAYAREAGPCDRMGGAPVASDFTVAVGQSLLLSPAPAGYRLSTALGSCMLVDGAGQYGDVGYPMSIPAWTDRDERIAAARWDDAEQEGFVRLELHPAYSGAQGVLRYTRDFLLAPARLVVRDMVVLDRPRALSWLFQGVQSLGLELEGLAARFGRGPALRLEPDSRDLALAGSIHETRVVWSYNGPGEPRCHVRYDALAPVQRAQVDFILTWS
ncbi:MAG TPA: hypothetical protein P5137_15935, partial [Candidatus Brocadiia bacterium]|nr:hypothetical protein [Candidatus Brocadiia bacterium]